MYKRFKTWNDNEILKFVRDNVGLIVLIPTLLGGLWQGIALASMNFAYLRFFSITQVPSDGLLLLIPLFFLILEYNFALISFRVDPDLDNSKQLKWESSNREKWIGIAIYSLQLVLLIAGLNYLHGSINNQGIGTIIVVWPLVIGMTIGVINSLNRIAIIISKFFKIITNRILTDIKFVIVFLVGAYGIYVTCTVILNFNSAFILPPDIENEGNLICLLKKEDNRFNYKVRYFNDVYLFVNVLEKRNDTLKPKVVGIKVMKTEELLTAPSCRPLTEMERADRRIDSILKVHSDRWKKDSVRIEKLHRVNDSLFNEVYKKINPAN